MYVKRCRSRLPDLSKAGGEGVESGEESRVEQSAIMCMCTSTKHSAAKQEDYVNIKPGRGGLKPPAMQDSKRMHA